MGEESKLNKAPVIGQSVKPEEKAKKEQDKKEESPKRAPSRKRRITAYLTKTGILAALSTVLYLFARFPIFSVFPFSVLDMDFSDIPALIGGFAMGPVSGVAIVLIKCVIKLATSETMFVGELSNFIVGVSLVLPATLFYKYHKTFKGAVFSLLIGVAFNAVISVVNNYFITVPLYSTFAPVVMEVRVEFACYYGLAFNLLKSVVASVVTLLLYKRLSPLLHL